MRPRLVDAMRRIAQLEGLLREAADARSVGAPRAVQGWKISVARTVAVA